MFRTLEGAALQKTLKFNYLVHSITHYVNYYLAVNYHFFNFAKETLIIEKSNNQDTKTKGNASITQH